MNRTELVAAICEQTKLTKKDAEKAVKAFVQVVSDELAQGGKVQLVGFGTFEVTERGPREGRNPHTGESLSIPATRLPRFKAGRTLKNAVK